ncbi:hypothetical protein FJQ87_07450 [Shewanella sp. SNU WT4]|uniref:hypothetical protein n=1 Tax=Shewanella sp. SNU WT4 TaxID=2590015 RepID=UPI001127AA2F|nr:hypothetical protein [Shewanella sp. SNU WT4]QDF66561.1 hypothetical protein FJQ87_07450 [Shewanella sp. SNU WT4]
MKLVVALLSLVLTACSSIPSLSSLQFSLMNDDYITKLNADDIRAKVISTGDDIKLAAPVLTFTAKTNQKFHFELVSDSVQRFEPSKGFFFASLPKTEYLYRLSAQGRAEFIKMQQLVNSGQVSNLEYHLDLPQAETHVAANDLTLALKLESQQNFITLLDEWEFAKSSEVAR